VELTNEQVMWAVIAIVALIAIIIAIFIARSRERSRESDDLRSRFGPEYDRTVESTGDRRQAEDNLRHREERAESLRLRELSTEQRQHYANWWTQVQTMFVERPAIALGEADRLVTDLMRDRGYPATDSDTAMEDLSVQHGNLVQRLRRAKDAQHDSSGVEPMREAMLDYRAVVAELLAVDLRSAQERESR
jgi:hypothetical protein